MTDTSLAALSPATDSTLDGHALRSPYTLWFSQRTKDKTVDYSDNIKPVAEFNTIEDFWPVYCHIQKPNELGLHSDYHLFRTGVRPMWEDPANKAGGKWIIRLQKGLASRMWEDLMFAVLGDQFDVGDELCGVVVSVRFQEDILSVWNKSSSKTDVTSRIRDTLKRVLGLPQQTVIEYKDHDSSLRDHSSFRNTSADLR